MNYQKSTEIHGFFGKYRFLSNFADSPLVYNGIHFTCGEAAFHAQKCPQRAGEFSSLNPSEAKRLGRRVPLRPDWEDVKVDIMKQVVLAKFQQNPDLARRLKETAPALLFEENSWGDRFWGQVNGVGENHLGKILTELRDSGKL